MKTYEFKTKEGHKVSDLFFKGTEEEVQIYKSIMYDDDVEAVELQTLKAGDLQIKTTFGGKVYLTHNNNRLCCVRYIGDREIGIVDEDCNEIVKTISVDQLSILING